MTAKTKKPSSRPLCFVLMPFGTKPDPRGGPPIDFDAIYQLGIRPAIEAAGLEPIRADDESTGGIIHKAMFERLLLCEFAVADLTTGSPNVFYELGIRHAVRERTTLPIFAEGHTPPFDLNMVRALPYRLGDLNSFGPEEAEQMRNTIATRLRVLREEYANGSKDSPVFQLMETLEPPDIERLRTDTFRSKLEYEQRAREDLAAARSSGDVAALDRIRDSMGDSIADEELGVLLDLFLSYRAVSAWSRMLDLYEGFPRILQRTRIVREQRAFALNRSGRRDEAESVLREIIKDFGASSETNGLLGRIYKDRWMDARQADRTREARSYLRQAISAYRDGFLVDPRDAYPGINAVTLLEIEGSPQSLSEKNQLLPVVRMAVQRRLLTSNAVDYWDHATRLELAVLAREKEEADRVADEVLASVREGWEPKSTANNLRMIHSAWAAHDQDRVWLQEVIDELEQRGREFEERSGS